jgi:4-diphosphocytidyl-2-C-methyl-D-erythritol kinase
VIPSGAGLGGGSADGAFMLLLLNQKFQLGLKEHQLLDYALSLGSDCPFFIKNTPSFASGRGEALEAISLDLSSFKFVLVNPGIHINTGWAFSKIQPSANRPSIKNIIHQPITAWKDLLKNDFEEVVFKEYPSIKDIPDQLYQQGALYASMTGSGSTVFGIFERSAEPMNLFPEEYFFKVV